MPNPATPAQAELLFRRELADAIQRHWTMAVLAKGVRRSEQILHEEARSFMNPASAAAQPRHKRRMR